jgi:hypothetical protein
VVEDIKQYQRKWLEHVERMSSERLPWQAYFYTTARCDLGQPRTRFKQQFHSLRTGFKAQSLLRKKKKITSFKNSCFSKPEDPKSKKKKIENLPPYTTSELKCLNIS